MQGVESFRLRRWDRNLHHNLTSIRELEGRFGSRRDQDVQLSELIRPQICLWNQEN